MYTAASKRGKTTGRYNYISKKMAERRALEIPEGSVGELSVVKVSVTDRNGVEYYHVHKVRGAKDTDKDIHEFVADQKLKALKQFGEGNYYVFVNHKRTRV